MFDKILLLTMGRTVWFGPTKQGLEHFASLGYQIPSNTNPSDFFLDTITLDQRNEKLVQESTERITKFQDAWKLLQGDVNIKEENSEELRTIVVSGCDPENCKPSIFSKKTPQVHTTEFEKPGYWVEFFNLLGREGKLKRRDITSFVASAIQSIIMVGLIGGLFWQSGNDYAGVQNKIGGLYFLCIQLTFSNVMPLVAVLPTERSIVKRERAAGSYSSFSFYFARWVVSIPQALLFSFVLAIPVYFMIGFRNETDNILKFLLVVAIHAITANAIAFFIGAAAPSVTVAQIASPVLLTLFLLFGGPVMNLETIPSIFKWMQYVSLISYSNKALSQNEFAGQIYDCTDSTKLCYPSGDVVIRTLAIGNPTYWYSVIYNVVIAVSFLIVGAIMFERLSRPLLRLK
jgi:ABC-type multidrug transport system permease subunit